MPADNALRLAVDIGGTFTDAVLIDGDGDGAVRASAKTLTTHDDPSEGALAGARRALEDAGASFEALTGFVHGTTLATNALIERRGAKTATITTAGFRDILEIAYERRYSQYDIDLEKPDLLVPRARSFTIEERLSVAGEVLAPLDEAAIPALAASLDQCGAEAVAICLLHAYANPEHEERLRDRLRALRPGLEIAISSEVSPEAREFDRLCTTVANAYVQPLMAGYLGAFEARFRAAGLGAPILMMTAGGGMCALETAARLPIRLVESGPAGGAVLAARIAAERGLDAVLSFDMGGTTAKLCLIDDARPQSARRFEIARKERFVKGSGMPVRIPVVEMIEIGAGGGSIAAVDPLGRLRVGPESAGSEPGPAAFAKGGARPTVTDADIALGYVRPEGFAEGQFALDPAAGRAAIACEVGDPLGLDAEEAADGVAAIVDEAMASAARMHAVESGKDLRQRTMIAFGGNGPLHACRLARSAGVDRVLVPRNPGVGSAVGFLWAPVSFETVRSRHMLLRALDLAALDALFAQMIEEARAVVRAGAPDAPFSIERAAFMRYRGQGHEIEIALPGRALEAGDAAALAQAFEKAYAAQFSRPVPGMDIEILNWAVRLRTEAPAHRPSPPSPPSTHAAATKRCPIRCDLTGRQRDAVLVRRADLAPGATLTGPALVVEPQTTTFVAADFRLAVAANGDLDLERMERRS